MSGQVAFAILGVVLIGLILVDAFEVLILPQTVRRDLRPARLFYRSTWSIWRGLALRLPPGRRREGFLGVYGPLSLLILLIVWAYCLILGFALLHWGIGSQYQVASGQMDFGVVFYMSGTTFFTLGLGDVAPMNSLARVLTMIEAGTGFGFLALVIGYLPVLYQAFSRRELNISLLDARAGSPPSAEELLRRQDGHAGTYERMLASWERWAAELMESHLSYPVLAYYRSQHQNQSWLAALTTILDVSAFLSASAEGPIARQARLTFAMGRHAVVDLAQVFRAPPRAPGQDRLLAEALSRMREQLARAGVAARDEKAAETELANLRRLYEPYVCTLAERFCFPVPSWTPGGPRLDNWQTSGWEKRAARAARDRDWHEAEDRSGQDLARVE